MLPARQVLRNLSFANQLTFLRLASIPFFALALLNGRAGLALALFVAAGVTDMLDGLIARIFKMKTALGAFLDPAADKLLLTCALVVLSLPDHLKIAPSFSLDNRIPLWLTVLAISRDLFISVTALVLYLVSDIRRFPPTWPGKATTFAEIMLVSFVLLDNVRGVNSSLLIPVAVWVTLGLILISGFHYMYRTGAMLSRAHPPVTDAASKEAGGGAGAHSDAESEGAPRADLRVVAGGGSNQGSGWGEAP